ncbi:hypothetical protein B0H15DRAFT_943624 [Mycena belliarum]|uniref:F-box domain-containing protein n=1 Tax=Mycena belliarum TaxID=1033014 RepID=A0AAD6XWL1_9AGAR|nr:hypothetical protein B0H15DRAFT_943624 [Mycena belliae]
MEPSLSPLAIQELVDRCVGFLCNSKSDLRTCALLSRRWVCPAQSQLFRDVAILITDSKPGPLSEILVANPNLVHYIHRLHLTIGGLVLPNIFPTLCNLSFTSIKDLHLRFGQTLMPSAVTHIQQLFSLPTLQRVEISVVCSARAPSMYLQLWDRCSPALRHLSLNCLCFDFLISEAAPVPDPHSLGISLESLHLNSMPIHYISEERLLPPFELSHLRVLSLGPDAHMSNFPLLAHTHKTIEVLSYGAPTPDTIDLVGRTNRSPVMGLSPTQLSRRRATASDLFYSFGLPQYNKFFSEHPS